MFLLSKEIVFDSDVLSSFAVIKRLDILKRLYPNRILIPSFVIEELSRLKFGRLSFIYKDVIDNLDSGQFREHDLVSGSAELKSFLEFKKNFNMGKGEAACLAIAVNNDKIISSSNLRDVQRFHDINLIENIPVIEILIQMYLQGFESLEDIEKIKLDMINKGRKLPKESIYSILSKKYLLKSEDIINEESIA